MPGYLGTIGFSRIAKKEQDQYAEFHLAQCPSSACCFFHVSTHSAILAQLLSTSLSFSLFNSTTISSSNASRASSSKTPKISASTFSCSFSSWYPLDQNSVREVLNECRVMASTLRQDDRSEWLLKDTEGRQRDQSMIWGKGRRHANQ